jgi:alpha-mannosidase
VHDDRIATEDRIRRALRARLLPAVHRPAIPLRIGVWTAPGEPVPFAEAAAADYVPMAVGEAWGKAWSTSWLKVEGELPAEWVEQPVEALIDLGFGAEMPGFQAEGLAYSADGVPIKALQPRTAFVPVGPDPHVLFYVEAAANPSVRGGDPFDPSFEPTQLGELQTIGPELLYSLKQASLAVRNDEVWELVQDVRALDGLMRTLPTHDPRRHEILRSLERMLDRLDPDSVVATASSARKELAQALARPAVASAHTLFAVGHAHIDSAWLWPVRETKRKAARTFANVLDLMDRDPDFVFACSQAQQYEWIKETQPALYERLRVRVAEGRFVPVGGMWVESDTNMPGGEAMARQFMMGKRFFLEEFGLQPEEVWLPDSFGYSAALPQICRLAGMRWFLTQKISWNQINRMPHHTFWWEGIDGSRIFTHFPPVDTYNSQLTAEELAHASANFAEHGKATRSLIPFGFGNGGGGPTREMVAAARRTADLEGSPKVVLASPREFFESAEEEYPDASVWRGELYLEIHRGTYTSQARTKQGNRRSEHLLREAELWAAAADIAGLADYPYDELDSVWKTVLLNQFHDILPGSSIAWVHRQAEDEYADVARRLDKVIATSQAALTGEGSQHVGFNGSPFSRQQIAGLGADDQAPEETPVSVERDGQGGYELNNGVIRVAVNSDGEIASIFDAAAGREIIPAGRRASYLQLHRDIPNRWDAWDLDEHYKRTVSDLAGVDRIATVDDGVLIHRSFGKSRIVQEIRLPKTRDASAGRRVNFETTVEWYETEKLLKVGFDLDVHAEAYASETQFGHVYRPTHRNTSWDAARFETCVHRWAHVGEPGYGVAVANDSTYGHDVTRETSIERGTCTMLRMSLLRAPRFPDPTTDHGTHVFRYSLLPGADILDAVEAGYDLNLPVRVRQGSRPVAPLVTTDCPAIVVEAAKLADDRSGDLVLRLYEAAGGRASGRLTTSIPVAGVQECDLLERPQPDKALHGWDSEGFDVALRPFQVLTVRVAHHDEE